MTCARNYRGPDSGHAMHRGWHWWKLRHARTIAQWRKPWNYSRDLNSAYNVWTRHVTGVLPPSSNRLTSSNFRSSCSSFSTVTALPVVGARPWPSWKKTTWKERANHGPPGLNDSRRMLRFQQQIEITKNMKSKKLVLPANLC